MSVYSFRITTNGVLRNYRSNLNKSYSKLNSAMERVQTQRRYNSYAEDPTSASRAFQIRRSLWRNDDQLTNTNNTISKFQTAYSAVATICDGDVEHPGLNGISASLQIIHDPTGSSRKSLGTELRSEGDGIVQMMNATYDDSFVFAGADGKNVPFTWYTDGSGNKSALLYRGIDVDTPDPALLTGIKLEMEDKMAGQSEEEKLAAAKEEFKERYGMPYEQAEKDYAKLEQYLGESTYVDIGLGLKEDENGAVPTSAYDTALHGLKFIGYGVDQDGDPKNVVSLMRALATITDRCDPETGTFASTEDQDTADRLTGKLQAAIGNVSEAHVELSAKSTYLQSNVKLLTVTQTNLDEQRTDLEEIDPAMAITEMTYANYCYNAALKIGNSVLSESLLDYMS